MPIENVNQDNVAHVHILIVVDTARAMTGGLQGNFYLVSTRGHHDPAIPVTTVRQGDKLIWRAMPLNPDHTVGITGFGGRAVPRMVNPSSIPTTAMWGSLVTTAGLDVPYELSLTIDGAPYSCKCLLTAAARWLE